MESELELLERKRERHMGETVPERRSLCGTLIEPSCQPARAVPVHAALRETGGLQCSAGKFWDQQITALLPPLTHCLWAA
ncbi:hypothetical protein AOLI_G00099380 [Acnodon oligacanthus]